MQLQRAFKVIKSVQRGRVDTNNANEGAQVIVSTVDPAKSYLIVNGLDNCYQVSATVNAGFLARIENSNSLRFVCVANRSASVSWELVEYV